MLFIGSPGVCLLASIAVRSTGLARFFAAFPESRYAQWTGSMRRGNRAADPPADGPATFDADPLRAAGGYQVVENAIGHVLVESAFVAKLLEIKLEALEFDAKRAWYVADAHRGEVGLPGLGTQTGELVNLVVDEVVAVGMRIVEGFEHIQ